jgi:transmembrane 9 superfamily protein 2/4
MVLVLLLQRWEMYLRLGADDDIHWFSIVNSLMIVLFLTGMIAMVSSPNSFFLGEWTQNIAQILIRNLYRDISKYNEEPTAEEAAEETVSAAHTIRSFRFAFGVRL